MGGRGASSSINRKKITFSEYTKAKNSGDKKTIKAWNNQRIKILEKEMKDKNNYNLHYEIDRLREENKNL